MAISFDDLDVLFDGFTEKELIALTGKLDSAYEDIRDINYTENTFKMATEINDLATQAAATLWILQANEARRLGVI